LFGPRYLVQLYGCNYTAAITWSSLSTTLIYLLHSVDDWGRFIVPVLLLFHTFN